MPDFSDEDLARIARSLGETAGVAGRRLGRYRLIERIGEGGTGLVFRAFDEELGREVALKTLKTVPSFDPNLVERFRREAQLAARLRHPGIVTIHDVGRHEDTIYLAMELVEGLPLQKVEGDLPARVEILERTARAVQHAHERGVLHRDLKPANILVDRAGNPRLLDFGVSRDLTSPSELTRTGSLVGTPAYMAPEQADDGKGAVDARCDVYGLGAVLYHLLTGRPPFKADPPRPPGPPELVTICLKAMERDPGRRYPTAGAFADDLRRHLDGQAIEARPPGMTVRARRILARHRWPFVVTACILVIAGLIVVRRPDAGPSGVLEAGALHAVGPEGRAALAPGQPLPPGALLETAAGAVVRYDGRVRLTLPAGAAIRPMERRPGAVLVRGEVAFEVKEGSWALASSRAEVEVGPGRGTFADSKLSMEAGTARLRRLSDFATVEVPAAHYAVVEPGVDLAARPIPPVGNVPADGVALWLRGGEGASVDETRGAAWADAARRGPGAFQGDVRIMPGWIPDAVEGQPVWRFNGETQHFQIGGAFEAGEAGLSLFLVTRFAGYVDHSPVLTLGFDSPEPVRLVQRLGTLEYRVGEASLPAEACIVHGEFQVISVVASRERATIFSSGVAVASGPFPLPSPHPREKHFLDEPTPFGSRFHGDIAEMILFQRAVSDVERKAVEHYLSAKYLGPAGRPRLTRGLLGRYYRDPAFTDLVAERIDPEIDLVWGWAGPVPELNSANFSARWTGTIEAPRTGAYQFSARTTESVRIWIDDALVPADGAAQLEAGRRHRIAVEYVVGSRPCSMTLYWDAPGMGRRPVPQTALRPSTE